MASNKRIVLALAIIAAFILLVFLTVFTYQVPNNSGLAPLFEFFLHYHVELMILLGVVGILVGASVFYLMSERVEQKGSEAKAVAELLLRFLGSDEKQAVKALLLGNGKILQAEMARLPNMTRLKAHRLATKLEQRGVIDVQRAGKLKVIHLKEELRAPLLEK